MDRTFIGCPADAYWAVIETLFDSAKTKEVAQQVDRSLLKTL